LVQSVGKQRIWEHDDINLPIDDTLEDVDDVSNSTIEPKEEVIPNVDLDKIISSKLSLYVDPNNTIAEFKSIISETAVSYNDVANYTLEILGRKIDRLLTKFDIGYKTLSCAKIVNIADRDTVQNKRKSAQCEPKRVCSPVFLSRLSLPLGWLRKSVLGRKERMFRSIAPQERQGHISAAQRRMAAKCLSAGFGSTYTRGYPM
jgi:hypothetical protein